MERPTNAESTVLGAAVLAGLQAGMFVSTEEIARLWRRDALFEPAMAEQRRNELYSGWLDAISRVCTKQASGHRRY